MFSASPKTETGHAPKERYTEEDDFEGYYLGENALHPRAVIT